MQSVTISSDTAEQLPGLSFFVAFSDGLRRRADSSDGSHLSFAVIPLSILNNKANAIDPHPDNDS